jgi:uncharacterized membrane protein HdeD (DUF308 family)
MKKLKTWWLLFFAGTILFSTGIYSWLAPLSAYYKLVKYSGFVLLMNGLLLMWASAKRSIFLREKKWMLTESIINFFFGILLIVSPILSFIVFPLLIGHWILCLGILKIFGSLSLQKDIRGWLFILMTGILSVVFGILIAYVPFTKGTDVTVLIGGFGVTMGSLSIIDSFRFRKMEGTLNMMF